MKQKIAITAALTAVLVPVSVLSASPAYAHGGLIWIGSNQPVTIIDDDAGCLPVPPNAEGVVNGSPHSIEFYLGSDCTGTLLFTLTPTTPVSTGLGSSSSYLVRS